VIGFAEKVGMVSGAGEASWGRARDGVRIRSRVKLKVKEKVFVQGKR
jgi:hypothetical protein